MLLFEELFSVMASEWMCLSTVEANLAYCLFYFHILYYFHESEKFVNIYCSLQFIIV